MQYSLLNSQREHVSVVKVSGNQVAPSEDF